MALHSPSSGASEIFRSLGDPTRVRIVALLREMELTVGELAQVLGQSQPRVSRHVRILIEAGLLDRRKEGSWVFLSLGEPRRMKSRTPRGWPRYAPTGPPPRSAISPPARRTGTGSARCTLPRPTSRPRSPARLPGGRSGGWSTSAPAPAG
jgi:DNA-binding transcriptional ArsR family regulator